MIRFLRKNQYVALVMLLIVVGIVTVFIFYNRSNPDIETPVITYSTDSPEEQKPQETNFRWVGKKSDPKKIVIDKINVDAFIQNVGVDQNNEIAVPNNIHIAGWFVDSVRPGERGLSIIDGHVNGRNSDDGVFKRLPELAVGDTIKVIFGDNSQTSFIVKENRSISTIESAPILFSQIPSIERQLNLVTCTGSYNQELREYDKRQITILEKIN